jgi:hypothetical protein
VQRFLVSHGKNSGWLYATRFSNRPESHQSPLGFFRTGRKYYGGHGPSLELSGLQKGINDNTVCRRIVMHGAHYAGWGAVAANRAYGLGRLGRSLGCPAIPMEVAENVIDRIKGGSLLYMYAKNAEQGFTAETQRKSKLNKINGSQDLEIALSVNPVDPVNPVYKAFLCALCASEVQIIPPTHSWPGFAADPRRFREAPPHGRPAVAAGC